MKEIKCDSFSALHAHKMGYLLASPTNYSHTDKKDNFRQQMIKESPQKAKE